MGVVWGGERCVGRRDGCGVWEEKWVWGERWVWCVGGEMGVIWGGDRCVWGEERWVWYEEESWKILLAYHIIH